MSARILVVEDDIHLLSGISDILKLEDYSVTIAENGLEGLEILRQDPNNPPDIIVSDIMMPELDGFAFLEEVRKEKQWVTIPFIFLTAKGEKSDQYRGSMMGADVYLTKPFNADDLLVAVASRLNRQRDIKQVQADAIGDVKKQVLGLLNHEMRTPLTLVVAYADMLKQFDPDDLDGEELMSFLSGVNSGARRLRRLIEKFINIVEIENGEAEQAYETNKRITSNLFIPLQRGALRAIEDDPNEACDFVIEDNLPQVAINEDQISIIVRELVDNSVKFSEPGSRVEVGAKRIDEGVEIWVRDTGRGISPQHLEHIWEPFYQVDREVHEDQGAGSGLAIVHGLTSINKGTCSIESELNAGSTVRITFPCAG